MAKRVIVGLLLAVSLGLAGWFLYAPYILMPSVTVADVCRAETLVLGEKTGNPHTHGITIRGSGEIDGEATITLLLNGEPYEVAKVRGKVDFEWGGDWYAETAEIRYEPANVRSGKVVLYYKFFQ